jgi:hypothetical protein
MGKTKEQELIEQTIADMNRAAEDTFRANVKSKLQSIAGTQAQIKLLTNQLNNYKKELAELKLADPTTLESLQ